jgi:hypothetical protein
MSAQLRQVADDAALVRARTNSRADWRSANDRAKAER